MTMHATLDTRSPTTTLTTTAALTTDRSLCQLEQIADDRTVDVLLQRFLARRRAVRQARRELAAEQARGEHDQLVQRSLLASGLIHLR